MMDRQLDYLPNLYHGFLSLRKLYAVSLDLGLALNAWWLRKKLLPRRY